MFKVVFVLYEGSGLDRSESLRYWRETHGPLVGAVPGVRRYVQSHAIGAPDGSPPFLGTAELVFDDEESFGKAAGSEEFAAAVADVANFADASRLPTAYAEDHVIVG